MFMPSPDGNTPNPLNFNYPRNSATIYLRNIHSQWTEGLGFTIAWEGYCLPSHSVSRGYASIGRSLLTGRQRTDLVEDRWLRSIFDLPVQASGVCLENVENYWL